ncbi:MAG: hypothetical protein IPH98_00270 [Saprospiraceae bacterium]|nr:hypothetical protein [Candidatus Defluviibacterium haderslevense]
MSNPILKQLLPHIAVIGIFVLVSSYFFYPHWQGKVMQQGDVSSWEGAAKEILTYNKNNPHDPALWTQSMFSGMPSYQIATPMESNFFIYVQKVISLGFLTGPVAILFYFMISFYCLYLVLGLSSGFACVGALSSALVTGNFILWEAGHLPKLVVLAMIGFIVAGLILSYRGRWWSGAALFALGMGINILNNHVQMSYYAFLLISPLVISYAIYYLRNGDWKSFLIPSGSLAAITVLALLASANSILPTYEYAKQTMRGGHILKEVSNPNASGADVNESGLQWDYAMNWSNGMIDLISGIIPGAAGGGSSEPLGKDAAVIKDLRKKGYNPPKNMKAPLYWGALPFTSGPYYFGAAMCFLFVLGLFIVRGPLKWWIAIAVLLGLLLSMGRHFEFLNKLMFEYFPLYSKFRAPSSVLAVTSYFVPILAMLALVEISKKEMTMESFKKKLIYSVSITGGICLFFILLGSSFFSFESANDASYVKNGFSTEALISDRQSLMTSDSIRSLVIILLVAGIVFYYFKNKFSSLVAACLLGAITLFDLGGVAKRYVSYDDFVSKLKKENNQKARPVDLEIMKDPSNYRVLDLTVNTFNSSEPSFFHKNVGGYHPAKLQRYQDIIDRHIDPEINQLTSSLQTSTTDSSINNALASLEVLNMLNTKYFILGQPGKEISLPNRAAFGNAWFVNAIQTVQTPDEEIQALNNPNLKQTAIVASSFQSDIKSTQFDAQGTISLISSTPNKLVYESNCATDQFAVFSEVWYGPDLGWTVSIDGKETPLIRANYVLRSCNVPSGKHQIILEFKPRSYHLGTTLSMICSLLLIGFMGFVGYKEWFGKKG